MWTSGDTQPENEPNTNTTVSSCLSKKNLVYVETSNVLQLDISLSFKRVKAKIKENKNRNEHPSRCTQNRHFLKMYADVTDRKQRKPGGQLTGGDRYKCTVHIYKI